MNRRWIKILSLLMILAPGAGLAATVRARLDDNGLQHYPLYSPGYGSDFLLLRGKAHVLSQPSGAWHGRCVGSGGVNDIG